MQQIKTVGVYSHKLKHCIMDFNNEKDLQEAKRGILSMTEKACAMIRARKLKLSEKQKEVLSEIINDRNGMVINWRTYESLLKKGYIVRKKSKKFNTSDYLINF